MLDSCVSLPDMVCASLWAQASAARRTGWVTTSCSRSVTKPPANAPVEFESTELGAILLAALCYDSILFMCKFSTSVSFLRNTLVLQLLCQSLPQCVEKECSFQRLSKDYIDALYWYIELSILHQHVLGFLLTWPSFHLKIASYWKFEISLQWQNLNCQ